MWISLPLDATLHVADRSGWRTIWSQTMLELSDTIRAMRTQDGGVLLDIRHGQIFSLNIIGSEILELLRRGFDETSMVDRIACAYNADAAQVSKDVREFLDALRKHDILRSDDPSYLRRRSDP
jgi:hypothetical protein